jgi:hypothetical protein
VGRPCGTHERGEKVYKVLVGKPEGKIPHGRLRRRWEDGIKMDLMEIGWGGIVDSVGSGRGPVACSCKYVINLRVVAPRS